MSYHIHPFESLPIRHYFMFGQVMQKPEICQLFLEELFGWDIEKIEYVDREKDLTDSYFSRGIRLDIYVRNPNKVYNIEMQSEKEDALERRIRYYQSGIDREELRRGVPYSELPETFIIFVCDYDPFEEGSAIYEREMFWKYSRRPCNDGTHAILLNSHYTDRNVSPAMLEFLDYVRTNDDDAEYSSSLVNQTKEQVKRVRLDKEVGEKYMLHELKIQDALNKGEKIGTEKGIKIGTEKGIKIGTEKGIEIGTEKGIRIGTEKGIQIGTEKGIKIGTEKGLKIGTELHLIDQICKKLVKGKSIEAIADEVEEELSIVKSIYKIAEQFAPDYDPEKIYEVLQNSISSK